MDDLISLAASAFALMGQIWSLYTGYLVLAVPLVLWLLRKVAKLFGLL